MGIPRLASSSHLRRLIRVTHACWAHAAYPRPCHQGWGKMVKHWSSQAPKSLFGSLPPEPLPTQNATLLTQLYLSHTPPSQAANVLLASSDKDK
eukprot:scaffold65330_cov24-Tisochrysis_lutea.AAC.3